jgi:predicted RNA-binding protein YlqC (UPF0109 family)
VSKELVEYIVGWLLDHPEDVEITEAEGDRDATVLEVTVHPEDMGKIIGKRGRIIRAVRLLARAAGQGDGSSVFVEVVD